MTGKREEECLLRNINKYEEQRLKKGVKERTWVRLAQRWRWSQGYSGRWKDNDSGSVAE